MRAGGLGKMTILKKGGDGWEEKRLKTGGVRVIININPMGCDWL